MILDTETVREVLGRGKRAPSMLLGLLVVMSAMACSGKEGQAPDTGPYGNEMRGDNEIMYSSFDASAYADAPEADAGRNFPDSAPSEADAEPSGEEVDEVDESVADPCEKGDKGVPVNPGCDEDVQNLGLTAIAGVDMPSLGGQAWLVLAGRKYWIYRSGSDSAPSGFTGERGPDVSVFFAQLPPDCSQTTTGPGGEVIPVNPGCDATVQTYGIDAAGAITIGGKPTWLVTSKDGKAWVFQDDRFVPLEGGLVAFLRGSLLPNDCTVNPDSGIPYNPGCDAQVAAEGFSALGAGNGAAVFAFRGRTWWELDTTAGRFVANGQDSASAMLSQLAPHTCHAKDSATNLPLNPGCDDIVQQKGISAIGAARIGGVDTWLVFAGNGRGWIYQDDAFRQGLSSVAAWLLTL